MDLAPFEVGRSLREIPMTIILIEIH